MSKAKESIIFIAIILIIFFLNGTPFIFGDGYGYYHTAKTLATQGSFTTETYPEYTPYSAHGVVTREDNVFISSYPPGVSILWWSFLKIASVFDQGTIYSDYFKGFNGHSLADGLAVLTASLVYTSASIVMLRKLLKLKGFSSRISNLATVGAYIGTFAVNYATQQPAYVHTYEIFAYTLFLLFFEKFHISKKIPYLIIMGIAASLLIAIRPVDAVLLLPILILLVRYTKKFLFFLIGALPIAAFFLYYNFISYGSPFISGYTAVQNQNFNLNQFKLFEILFSDFRGLFFWSLIIILTLVILILKTIKHKKDFLVYGLPPILLVFVYCFWPYWWAGDSIGNRFFICLTPIVGFGLSKILVNNKNTQWRILKFFALSTIFYSLLIGILYRITPTSKLIPSNSAKAKNYQQEGISPADLASPFDMIKYHFQTFNSSKSPSEYLLNLSKSFNGGRSLVLLALDTTEPLIIIEPIDEFTFLIHTIPELKPKPSKEAILLYFKEKNYYIRIENVDFSVQNNFYIDCTKEACTSPQEITTHNLETVYEKESVKITSRLDIWIDSTANINFINRKIRNL